MKVKEVRSKYILSHGKMPLQDIFYNSSLGDKIFKKANPPFPQKAFLPLVYFSSMHFIPHMIINDKVKLFIF